jgi:metallopeptidase MepB
MEVLAGKRYRSIVLEPGSSRPEAETLELFLGRKPNGEAYYSELCSLIGFRVNNVLFT